MYTPAHFAEADLGKLHAAIEAYSFATLVCEHDGELTASHLPLLLRREGGPAAKCGTLVGHMAKANAQWGQAAGKEVLAIFSGPHTYISPTWYQDEKTVPTWNYVAVHATGTGALVEDPEQVKALLADLVRTYESPGPSAWSFEGLAPDYLAGMQRGIVAFEIPIDRLEGKAKLSQNRDAVDQARTREALAATDDPLAQTVAALMAGAPPR